jgi:hypothetical protein
MHSPLLFYSKLIITKKCLYVNKKTLLSVYKLNIKAPGFTSNKIPINSIINPPIK